MKDNLIFFGSDRDQALPTEDEFTDVRMQVNQKVEEAIQEGDLDKATFLVRTLIKVNKVAGRELARVLFRLSQQWSVFQTEETFMEWADREVGLHPHTVERYVRIENLLNKPDLSPEVRKELSERNMAELFPIANMVEQGYEPDEAQWQKILLQPDDTSIRAVVRDIKGADPRPTALAISMDDTGSLWATRDGVRKFVGSLEVTDESPIVVQAVERITRNAGVLR